MNRDHLSGAHALGFLMNLEERNEKIWPPAVAKPATVQPPSIVDAFAALTSAASSDPGYAWTWHCNLAMAMVDEGVSHEKANRAAARFMYSLFSVDTAQFEEFKAFEPVWMSDFTAKWGALCSQPLTFVIDPAINWQAAAECSDVAKADAGGWIPWDGGVCPVDVAAQGFVRLRNGIENNGPMPIGSLLWGHEMGGADIVAYRLASE